MKSFSKVLFLVFALFFFTSNLRGESVEEVAYLKAGFSSPLHAWVSAKFWNPFDNEDVFSRTITYSGNLILRARYEVKDSSRTACGRPKVSANIRWYNFSTFKWEGSSGGAYQGPKTRIGKYRHKGKIDMYPMLGSRQYVGRFKLVLEAKSNRGKHTRKERIFYVVRPFRAGESYHRKNILLKWAIQRYEKAVTYEKLAETWKGFKNVAGFNGAAALKEIVVQATGYLSDTSPAEFGKSSGLEILTGCADMFGETVSAGGEVVSAAYSAYTYIKTSKQILQSSLNAYNRVMGSYLLSRVANTIDLDRFFERAAAAVRNEADKCIGYIYNQVSFSEWRAAMESEWNFLDSLNSAISTARRRKDDFLYQASPGISESAKRNISDKVENYLRFACGLTNQDRMVLCFLLKKNSDCVSLPRACTD